MFTQNFQSTAIKTLWTSFCNEQVLIIVCRNVFNFSTAVIRFYYLYFQSKEDQENLSIFKFFQIIKKLLTFDVSFRLESGKWSENICIKYSPETRKINFITYLFNLIRYYNH